MSNDLALRPQTFEQLVQFAGIAAKSSFVPVQYKNKPEDILLAMQLGGELGLAPMQSLQSIAVINGRPAVFGDAMPGLCRQSAVCDDIIETIEGDGDQMRAVCTAIRVGKQPVVRTFSVEDAKKAHLWGKQGPWTQYPRRMLAMRARSFSLRDAFPDVLRGLISAEEAIEITAEAERPEVIEAPSSKLDEFERIHGVALEEPLVTEAEPVMTPEIRGQVDMLLEQIGRLPSRPRVAEYSAKPKLIDWLRRMDEECGAAKEEVIQALADRASLLEVASGA